MWNTLDVPLENGWPCTLMPEPHYDRLMRWGRGYEDLSARCLYPRADRDFWYSTWNTRPPSEDEKAELWEKQRLRQLSDDQAAFARHFRPAWDLRTITGGNALDSIKTFLRDALSVVHWNMPKDNADIQVMLRKAVADNRLIPIVNRDYSGLSGVTLPDPVPQHWPSTGGGGYAFKPKVLTGADFDALRLANGELADASVAMNSAGLSVTIGPTSDLGSAASSRGGDNFDWLGIVEAAGALLGGYADSGDDSTPLSDAQPFEYSEGMPDGDSFDIAKTPNAGDPGTWFTNPGSGQMRLYGDDGQPVVDFDFDHDHGQGIPHAHNWAGGARGPGVPFSLLP